jgi:hypothetical protein
MWRWVRVYAATVRVHVAMDINGGPGGHTIRLVFIEYLLGLSPDCFRLVPIGPTGKKSLLGLARVTRTLGSPS